MPVLESWKFSLLAPALIEHAGFDPREHSKTERIQSCYDEWQMCYKDLINDVRKLTKKKKEEADISSMQHLSSWDWLHNITVIP